MTGHRWTQADYDALRACASLQEAYGAFPERTWQSVKGARHRLGVGSQGQREIPRGPQTPQEQAVWSEIGQIMGFAIRTQRRVDWGKVFAELRRAPHGINTGACADAGCGRPARTLGLCPTHYRRERLARPTGPRCQVAGCEGKRVARGWCARHYQRWRKAQRQQGSV